MASSPQAARLTEAHRLAQARLAATVVRQMLTTWGALDPQAIDATVARWLQVTLPIVRAQHQASSTLAATYLTQFRALELGASSGFVPALPTLDQRAATTSLLVTGPYRLKSATGALPGIVENPAAFRTLVRTAAASSARSGMRHALAGGRDTITDSVHSDRSALGFARATSGAPCAFCAMLASRGPVYRDEDTAGFQPHDGCACQPEPVYRADTDWPSGAREYRTLWDEATAGESGEDALNAFRRAL